MNKELIIKINRCNLPKEDKKQLIESLNKGEMEEFVKKFLNIIFMGDKICNYFDIDLKDFF